MPVTPPPNTLGSDGFSPAGPIGAPDWTQTPTVGSIDSDGSHIAFAGNSGVIQWNALPDSGEVMASISYHPGAQSSIASVGLFAGGDNISTALAAFSGVITLVVSRNGSTVSAVDVTADVAGAGGTVILGASFDGTEAKGFISWPALTDVLSEASDATATATLVGGAAVVGCFGTGAVGADPWCDDFLLLQGAPYVPPPPAPPGTPSAWPIDGSGPVLAPAHWDFHVTEPGGALLTGFTGDAGGSVGTRITLNLCDANEAVTVWPSTLPVAGAVWDQWRNTGTPVLRAYRSGTVAFSGELVSAKLGFTTEGGGLLTCNWRSGWGAVAGSTDDRAPLIAPQNHYTIPSGDQTSVAAALVGDFVTVWGAAITTDADASGVTVGGTILRGESVARVIEAMMQSPTGFEFIDQPLSTGAISNIHFTPLVGTTTGLIVNPVDAEVTLSPPVNIVAVMGDGPDVGFDEDSASRAAFGPRWFSRRENAVQAVLSARATSLLQPAPYPQISWTPHAGISPVALTHYGLGDVVTVPHTAPGIAATDYAVRITQIEITIAPDGTELPTDTNDVLIGDARGGGSVQGTFWNGTAPRSRDDVLRALTLTRRLATLQDIPVLRYTDTTGTTGGPDARPGPTSVAAGTRILYSNTGSPPYGSYESDGTTWKFITWT